MTFDISFFGGRIPNLELHDIVESSSTSVEPNKRNLKISTRTRSRERLPVNNGRVQRSLNVRQAR